MTEAEHESRAKLLDAAVSVIRAKGYSAARVDDICAAAGLTKGSFFHHFASKEELALAAAERWGAKTGDLFAAAAYHQLPDPLDRVLAYVDFRKSLLTGDFAEFTCFAGTIVQEAYDTHPEINAACARNIAGHAKSLEADIRAAMRAHAVTGDWSAESLALHMQGVIQGAFILAKVKGRAAAAVQSLDHLRRYLELLFPAPNSKRNRSEDQK